MSKKNYFFSVVEIENNRAYSTCLSKTRISFLLLIIAAILLSASYLMSRVLYFHTTKYQLNSLERENTFLKNCITSWESRTQIIESRLEELQKRNQEIRIAAALPVQKIEYGIGGPEVASTFGFIEIPKVKETEWNISKLENEVEHLHKNMTELEGAISSRLTQIAHYPSIRPVRSGWISSPFGKRIDPFTGQMEDHLAVDISIKPGSEVYATGAGVVKEVNKTVITNKGFGKYVLIDHGYGFETLYAHLSRVFVKEGQRVKRWDLIGLTGNTGKSTAPHLHYGVFANGDEKNPIDFILE